MVNTYARIWSVKSLNHMHQMSKEFVFKTANLQMTDIVRPFCTISSTKLTLILSHGNMGRSCPLSIGEPASLLTVFYSNRQLSCRYLALLSVNTHKYICRGVK